MGKIKQLDKRFKGVSAAAKKLGITRVHLSGVLHGRRQPSVYLAKRLQKMGIETTSAVAE